MIRRAIGWALGILGTVTAARTVVAVTEPGRPAPLPTRRRRSEAPEQLFAFIPRDTEFRRRLRTIQTEPHIAD